MQDREQVTRPWALKNGEKRRAVSMAGELMSSVSSAAKSSLWKAVQLAVRGWLVLLPRWQSRCWLSRTIVYPKQACSLGRPAREATAAFSCSSSHAHVFTVTPCSLRKTEPLSVSCILIKSNRDGLFKHMRVSGAKKSHQSFCFSYIFFPLERKRGSWHIVV